MNNFLDIGFLEGQASNPAPSSAGSVQVIKDLASAYPTPQLGQGGAQDPRTPVVPGTKSLRADGVTANAYACEMNAVEYHTEAPGISSSRMKHMLVSPAVYQLKLRRPMIETDALRIGRMLHTQVLEPHLLDAEFAIWNEGRRQGDEWAQFAMDNAHRTIITQNQKACVGGMAAALLDMTDFPVAAWLAGVKGDASRPDLAPATKEQSLFWVDEDTGLQCKARPDAMTLGQNALVGDVKSARSVAIDDFLRDIFKFRYDVQAAHYLAGVKAVYGVDARFAFFAAEKEEPHVARTFLMTPEALAHGERHRRYCLRMIRHCLDTGKWPKQPPGAQPVSVEAPFMQYDTPLKDMAAAYGITLKD